MAAGKDPWFVIERSEAVAVLLLTNQKDVVIASERKKDDGVDLLVALDGRTFPPSRQFVVQVKGTLSTDPADWVRNVKQLFRAGGGGMGMPYLPTCVFVVNVRDTSARYAWIAEAVSESPNGATLKIHRDPAFHELDDTGVAEIVGRVKAYYDAMPKPVLAAG